ncbi:MAG: SDR family NAD(P)-dependent oxidoreductase, partial [Pseudomonadota bacterium]
GPGRLPIAALERKDPVICSSEANPGNRIHRDDLVEALRLALVSEQAEGIYNVADGNFATGTEYYQRVASALGLDLPPEISREQAREKFSAMRYSFLRESRRLDTKRLRDHLGLELRYANLDEGIAASI